MGSMFKKSKRRSLLIGLVWIVGFIIVIGRLFWLQAVDHNKLLAAAKKRGSKKMHFAPNEALFMTGPSSSNWHGKWTLITLSQTPGR